MKTNNTMSKGAYFLKHLLYLFIGYIWYNNLLFQCLNGMTYRQSRTIFWLIIISGCTICYALTYEKNRTRLNAFINVLFSFGIYALLSLSTVLRKPIAIGLCIISIITILFGYLIFNRRIKCGANVGRVLKRRFCNWFLASRVVTTVVVTVVIGVGMASVIMNGNMLLAKTEAVIINDATSEWRVARKLNELQDLQEEKWLNLDVQGKLNVLQVVANIEARFLGLGHELNVGARPLPESADGKTLGQYTYTTHTISIDTSYLETTSAKDAVNTIAHEARHAYQRRAVEALKSVPEEYYNLYMFYDVCGFQKGFETYGNDSLEGYITNNLEIDARRYARESVEMFYEELERCLKAEKEKDDE